jgi:hypothetical protein
VLARRLAAGLSVLAAVLALGGCISVAPSPTYIVPPGSTVICPGGTPATFSNGAYHC